MGEDTSLYIRQNLLLKKMIGLNTVYLSNPFNPKWYHQFLVKIYGKLSCDVRARIYPNFFYKCDEFVTYPFEDY